MNDAATKRIIQLESITHRPYHIMVVDDTYKNIKAAEEYFGNLNEHVAPALKHDIERAFFYDPDKAIYTLHSFKENPDKRPTIVLTDLEMPGSGDYSGNFAGIDVVEHAFRNLIFPFVVTGRNYDKPDIPGHHGPNTEIYPTRLGGVRGKKDSPGTWEELHDEITRYLTEIDIGERELMFMEEMGLISSMGSERLGLFAFSLLAPLYFDHFKPDKKEEFTQKYQQLFKEENI